jgi:putative endonuclease
LSGAVSYHAGQAAEAQVAKEYTRRGHVVEARRWRGSGGEIDLILRDGQALIFVEVKKARDFARAATRLSPAQVQRIHATASEFLANEPNGQDTDLRFDLALVDAIGRTEIIENAFGF